MLRASAAPLASPVTHRRRESRSARLNQRPDPLGRRCRSAERSSRQRARGAQSRPLRKVLAVPRLARRVRSRYGGRAGGGIVRVLDRVRQVLRAVRRPSVAARGRQSCLGRVSDQGPHAGRGRDGRSGSRGVGQCRSVADGVRIHLQQLRDLLNRKEFLLRQTARTESKWSEAGSS